MNKREFLHQFILQTILVRTGKKIENETEKKAVRLIPRKIVRKIPKPQLEKTVGPHLQKIQKNQPKVTLKTFKPSIITEMIKKQPTLLEKNIMEVETKEIPVPLPKERDALFDMNLGRIKNLLKDIEVRALECQGPGKPLIIKKLNQIIKTDTSLTNQEILGIINEFSQKTRIPLSQIFRATYKNLTINAILSVTGNRFLITKIE